MHCAACQSRVQSALVGTRGVSNASVNLMLNSATVTYDERATEPEKLLDSIRATGYETDLPKAEAPAFGDQAAQDAAHAAELRELIAKTTVALVVAAITMILPMSHSGWRSWLLLALTTIVVGWSGRHFYTRAWRAFRHHTAEMNTLIAVGTGAAYIYSVAATVAPGFFLAHGIEPELYYEAVAAIIGLIL